MDLISVRISDYKQNLFRTLVSANKCKYYQFVHDQNYEISQISQIRFNLIDSYLIALSLLISKSGGHFIGGYEGFNYSRDQSKDFWNYLKTEEKKIKTDGILLIDPLNGRKLEFKNPNYKLPFMTFEIYFEELQKYQNYGFISFLFPSDNRDIALKMKNNCEQIKKINFNSIRKNVNIANQSYDMYNIYTNCDNEDERAQTWIHITNKIYAVLKSENLCDGLICQS